MSWCINIPPCSQTSGLVPAAEARRQVLAETCFEQRNGPPGTRNELQFEQARGLALAIIADLPEGHGIELAAAGHADEYHSTFSFRCSTGSLPDPGPEATGATADGS